MTDVELGGIDHVELSVPDRREAADWYAEALGFEVVEAFEDWAARPAYPLMISNDGGDTMLALFEGSSAGGGGGFRRVAFEASGPEFLQFREQLEEVPGVGGRAASVSDFGSACSVFFSDPYGHPLEVTTYDHAFVAGRLDRR